MKIAVVSNDQNTVSQHFGRSKYFIIYEVENGEVKNVEIRQRHVIHHSHHEQGGFYGHHHNSNDHDAMIAEMSDCQVLIAGGMGYGAYNRIIFHGINVLITDEKDAKLAVEKFLKGTLINLATKKLH